MAGSVSNARSPRVRLQAPHQKCDKRHVYSHDAEMVWISMEYFFLKFHDSLKSLSLPCIFRCGKKRGFVIPQTNLRFHHPKLTPNSNLTPKNLGIAELKAVVEYFKKALNW